MWSGTPLSGSALRQAGLACAPVPACSSVLWSWGVLVPWGCFPSSQMTNPPAACCLMRPHLGLESAEEALCLVPVSLSEHPQCQPEQGLSCARGGQPQGWVGQSRGHEDRKETLLNTCTAVRLGCLSRNPCFPSQLYVWWARLEFPGTPPPAFPSLVMVQERGPLPSLELYSWVGFALCNGIPCAFRDPSPVPACREPGGTYHTDAQTAGAWEGRKVGSLHGRAWI